MAYIVNRFRTSEEEIGHRYDSFKFDSQDLYCTYITTFHPDPSKRSTQCSLWSVRVEK